MISAKRSAFLMPLTIVVVAALLVVTSVSFVHAHGDSTGDSSARAGKPVPLLKDLVSHQFLVTTKSHEAQAYFNQGLILTYGFDHADAELSFLEAAKHDPDCAMAYWGVAFVLGTNINAPMADGAVTRAYQMAMKAVALSKRATPKEQALTDALLKRYAPTPVKDRSSLDKGFANAMRNVYTQYQDDPDVAVIFAESLMDLHPWDYWDENGQAQPWTPEIRTVLERVIKDFPDHPHVHHLYIHLMENSPTPEVTVPSADMIGKLAPASGHLVHMAGHAYYAAGLYHDCSLANERALGVDKELLVAFKTQGLYKTGYVPHVLHFLLASYMMEGRSREAVHAARALADTIDQGTMRGPGGASIQHFYIAPYYTLVRFGHWEDMLGEKAPAEDLLYPLGMWHYARGIALIRTDKDGLAEEELQALRKIAQHEKLTREMIWNINKASDLLAIASEVLAGELAAARGKGEQAVDHLNRAVAMEDKLPYDEPPPWYFPVRQSLGSVLLDLDRASEAEAVFRKDLMKNAENPWSLFGWAESLKKQNKTDLLPDVEKRFHRAWARADLKLTRPVF